MAQDSATTKKSLNLMLVESVELNLMVLQHQLQQMGHQVQVARSAEQAQSSLKSNAAAPQMILFGSQLEDPATLAATIRQTQPDAVLMQLTSGEDELTAQQQQAGIVARLSMPLSAAAFDAAVQKHLLPAGDAPAADIELLLDLKMLNEYLGLVGTPSLLKGIDMMAELMPGYLDELQAARASRDDQNTGRHAHKIKGAAGSLGLKRLQQTAARAQQVDSPEWQQNVDHWIQTLKEHFQADLEVLKQWLSRR